MRRVHGAAHRFRQGGAALRSDRSPEDRELPARWLLPAELALFERQGHHDRRHGVRVARLVLGDGGPPPSRDLMAAALLHDVGKTGTPLVPGRVRLPDRVIRVLLGRLAPGLLARLAREPARWPTLNGPYLTVHHARLGADLVRSAGSSERTWTLIADHEHHESSDTDLRRIVAADQVAT